MKSSLTFYNIFLLMLLLLANCKEEYVPDIIRTEHNFLAVEGLLNSNAGATTIITLSRTRRLSDTVIAVPELNAQVSIEGQSGTIYPLQNKGRGIYEMENVNMSNAVQYRLKIRTADGNEYASDYVPVKTAPPIDSLTWEQQNDVTIFVNTHDPQNNTRYYRWDFVETWEYHSNFKAVLGVQDGLLYYKDSANQTYACWTSANSTDIVIGTSTALTNDVISHAPVAVVPRGSEKIGVRYSILVKQYALTQEAYEYWKILQKNTEQTGGIFDAQPSQLVGNIHNVNNPAEPVIGFVSTGSVTEKRIFIDSKEVTDWPGGITGPACSLIGISQHPVDWRIYNHPDTNFAPYYFVTGGIIITEKSCVDCTTRGGTTTKPVFW